MSTTRDSFVERNPTVVGVCTLVGSLIACALVFTIPFLAVGLLAAGVWYRRRYDDGRRVFAGWLLLSGALIAVLALLGVLFFLATSFVVTTPFVAPA